jgi:hypothetical protein
MSPMRVVMKAFSARPRHLVCESKVVSSATRVTNSKTKRKQTVRYDDAEHRSGKREIGKEAGEIFVVGHVADAEDKMQRPTNVIITSIAAAADPAPNQYAARFPKKLNQVKL